ncbi:T9SS type A sorting domain-containing protein [bacterium]|nr:T9SS type A sorting domain-containing protein [bacterium]
MSSTSSEPGFPLQRPASFPGLFLLLLCFICIPALNPCFAQWQHYGLPLVDEVQYGYDCCTDENGGAWYIQNRNTLEYGYQIYLQHIDSGGYLMFGADGMMLLGDEPGVALIGIESTLDGGCLILYTRSVNGDGQVPYKLFSQRISSTGERMWGDIGIPASNSDVEFQIYLSPGGTNRNYTIPDGSGGMWALWKQALTYDTYLGGINMDGTLKYADDVFIASTDNSVRCKIIEDGDGGVAVLYGTGGVGDHRIWVDHYDADGISLLDDPVMLFQTNFSFGGPFCLIRGMENDFYYNDVDSRYIVRLDSLMNPMWVNNTPYHWDPPTTVQFVSTPVVQTGNRFAQVINIYWEAHMECFEDTGERPTGWGTEWGPLAGDSLDWAEFAGNNISLPDGDSFLSLVKDEIDGPSEDHYWTVQRIDWDGNPYWDQPTYMTTSHLTDPGTSAFCLLLDPESVCVFMQNGDNQRIHAFKVYLADGSVAGDTTSVAESTEPGRSSPRVATIESAYPNPFNRTVTLTLNLRQRGACQFIVQNILGQVVDHRRQTFSAGTQEFAYTPPEDLSSGIYLLRLVHSGTTSDVKKIAYLR